jgi:hypothetical protein
MKKQSTTQELKIEEAYNAFPFEVPSLKWEEGTGYYLESPSQIELENLARFFEDEPVHSTQLEVEIERWIKDKRLINAATRTLQTKGGLVYTTTNDFSDKDNMIMFGECNLAFRTLEEQGAEMDSTLFENGGEAWTDIILDNSDIEHPKYFAVYGEGAVTTNSPCIYVEVEPDEKLLRSITAAGGMRHVF